MTIETGSKRHPANPDGTVGPFPGVFTRYRTLDPVRGAALAAAVQWAGQGGDWKQEQPTTQRILEVAETFEQYLTGEEAHGDWVKDHAPGRWFASDPAVGPHRFSPVQGTRKYCLLFTGPNTVCNKEQDDPVHNPNAE